MNQRCSETNNRILHKTTELLEASSLMHFSNSICIQMHNIEHTYSTMSPMSYFLFIKENFQNTQCFNLTLRLLVVIGWISDSYCSIKPLCSGMGEVVPARTSPTLLPPFPRTVLQLSCFKVSQCINCRD